MQDCTRLNIEKKSEKTGIVKFYEFAEFSYVWFNLTSCESNLTSHGLNFI